MVRKIRYNTILRVNTTRLFKKYNPIKFAIIPTLTLNYKKKFVNCRGAPDESTCLTCFFRCPSTLTLICMNSYNVSANKVNSIHYCFANVHVFECDGLGPHYMISLVVDFIRKGQIVYNWRFVDNSTVKAFWIFVILKLTDSAKNK